MSDAAAPTANATPSDFADGLPFLPPDVGDLARVMVCFLTGTRIATPGGEVPVETLRPGDLVSLADGRALPVLWLGQQTVSRRFSDPLRVLPIRIRAGALGGALPVRDLLVSPSHAVLIGDVLVQAGALVNGGSIVRDTTVAEVFHYWHIELAEHALVLAEGLPAESLLDSAEPVNFDNATARPERPNVSAALPHPRVKSHRQLPQSVRLALAAAAEGLEDHNVWAA